MHILSFRQQTPICIFLEKADAYALSLIRVYETERKKESFVEEQSWDVLLRPIVPFSKKMTRIAHHRVIIVN